MSKYKDIEGSVPVHGDITPITRKKIEQLDSTLWPDMSVSQLWDQRIILNNRLQQASSTGSGAIVQQLQRGLQQLDALIKQKSAQAPDEMHLI